MSNEVDEAAERLLPEVLAGHQLGPQLFLLCENNAGVDDEDNGWLQFDMSGCLMAAVPDGGYTPGQEASMEALGWRAFDFGMWSCGVPDRLASVDISLTLRFDPAEERAVARYALGLLLHTLVAVYAVPPAELAGVRVVMWESEDYRT